MKTGILVLSAFSLTVLAGCGFGSKADKLPLEKKVRLIFTENCHRCHGEGGSPDADFYVLDHESLLASSIVPGKPEESRLFRKVKGGEMPLNGEPLSSGDQETVRQWIAAGAPDFNIPTAKRNCITPKLILELLQTDLKQLSADDRPFARYFSIAHLYNAELNDDRLETYRGALSRLLNSLSWQPKIVPPRPIDPSRTLFRIDLRHYRWNAGIWETIMAANPYGVMYGTPAEKFCTAATLSAMPLVRGDWFLFAASRPPLYHDILQLPKLDLDLEAALQVNVFESIRTNSVARAGITDSQASEHNRIIERHQSPLTRGAYWKTYDFASDDGLKSVKSHPHGPRGHAANAFDHDGGEIAFDLPNGLHAYMLVDAQGNRIDSPLVGTRRDQNGRDVVNGVSCMSCHSSGIILADDSVRQMVEASPNSFTRPEVDLVLALYPRQEKFAELQKKDAERFANAVIQSGARLADEDPVATLAPHYEADLSLKLAAAEAGLPLEEFLASWEKSPILIRDLGLTNVVGQTVPRELFLKTFGAIVLELELGSPSQPK